MASPTKVPAVRDVPTAGADDDEARTAGLGDIELGMAASTPASAAKSTNSGRTTSAREVRVAKFDTGAKAQVGAKEDSSSSMGWAWELSGPERPYLGAGLFGAALVGASYPMLGYLLSAMIAIFFSRDPQDMRNQASTYAYVFLGIGAVQHFGSYLSQYSFGVLTERLVRRVRERSLLKMLSMSVAWFDQPTNTAGSLAQQLATDALMVKVLVGERASTSTSQIVTVMVALAISIYECWQMTLVMAALLPLIGAALAVQTRLVAHAAGDAAEATNEAGQVASQALLNLRTVNAFGLEGMALRQVGDEAGAVSRRWHGRAYSFLTSIFHAPICRSFDAVRGLSGQADAAGPEKRRRQGRGTRRRGTHHCRRNWAGVLCRRAAGARR
jgi:hypothetical protein